MLAIFSKVFSMSITASFVVLAVMLLRFLVKKTPKNLSILLWLFVAFRLICPFSFESLFSLVPRAVVQTPNWDTATAVTVTESADRAVTLTDILPFIWIGGFALMLLYSLISYLVVRSKTVESVHLKENIWVCDKIPTAFVLGFLRPKIYVNSAIAEDDMEYVIAHEKTHIKKFDHLIKPFAFLLLSIYWFNPVMWIAYIHFSRDIEYACDEWVVMKLGYEIKTSYSTALLNSSSAGRFISACPLAFGSSGVKKRIRKILKLKKPRIFLMLLVAVISCLFSVAFLTDPFAIPEKSYTQLDSEIHRTPIDANDFNGSDATKTVVETNCDIPEAFALEPKLALAQLPEPEPEPQPQPQPQQPQFSPDYEIKYIPPKIYNFENPFEDYFKKYGTGSVNSGLFDQSGNNNRGYDPTKPIRIFYD